MLSYLELVVFSNHAWQREWNRKWFGNWWLLETLTEESDQRVLQDISLDPKIQISDHNDAEPKEMYVYIKAETKAF